MSKMAKIAKLDYAFFLCIGALLLVVVFIVMSKGGLRSFLGGVEGFSAPPIPESPQCPIGYKFFNDEQGASFCCRGSVNPYTHQCEAKVGEGRMETPYKEYLNQDSGGGDIACYFDGRSVDFCKNACDNDPKCKSYNNIHRGGRQEGCCHKYISSPISPFPGGGVDLYVKQEKRFVPDNSLCAFEPNHADPRDPKKTLPLCSTLIENTHAKNQAACPGNLPNYAMIGKCCQHNPDMDGFDCIASDNADTNKYCKIKGPLKPGERLCAEVDMLDSAVCPTQIPQKISYMTGSKEATAYGANAAGVSVPVCFGMNDVCIPDSAISYFQKENGLYKDKNISNWSYSCSGWSNVNVNKDQATKMNTSYP